MENEKQQLEALQDIRKMMQESSKFLSLSGLSGIFAGIYALIGAYLGYNEISKAGSGVDSYRGMESSNEYSESYELLKFKIIFICGAVLFLSLLTAFIFTSQKAKKNNEKLFDRTSKKVLWNMLVPLSAGGLFCLILLYHGSDFFLLISPIMLLFYGMALINSSKFVMHDIKILGYLEIILGLAACLFLGYGILFWALGFGVLHIIYGAYMWFKFDRAK